MKDHLEMVELQCPPIEGCLGLVLSWGGGGSMIGVLCSVITDMVKVTQRTMQYTCSRPLMCNTSYTDNLMFSKLSQ